MNIFLRTFTAAVAAISLAGPSYAGGGFYYGIGAAVSQAESESEGFYADETLASIEGTVGLDGIIPGNGTALEFSYSKSIGSDFTDRSAGELCSIVGDGSFYCTHDATWRLQAVFEIGKVAGFDLVGSIGYAKMSGGVFVDGGDLADGSTGGATFGLGFERRVRGNVHRVSLTHDELANSIIRPTNGFDVFEPSYSATSLIYTVFLGK